MFSRIIRVNPSDVSFDGRMKLRSLLDCFQNTAATAVEKLEGNTAQLTAKGYAWVLTDYEIDFTGDLPFIDETFTLRTYHDPSHGYKTLRMFRGENDGGKEFVTAKSCWLLVDLRTGKPVKPIAHLPEITTGDVEQISPEFSDIPPLTEADGSTDIHVGFHSIDYNGHVNNAVYFEWVYDNSPIDHSAEELKHVSASFRSGAKLGEIVALKFQAKDTKTVLFTVNRNNIKKPSACFMLQWRERCRGNRKYTTERT